MGISISPYSPPKNKADIMTNSQTRDSFIFYRSFYEAIQDLPKENQLELYNAIAQYSLNFEDPTLNGLSNTIFKLIKPQLDANNKRFINGQKGAEHGKKGAEHGKKGGRPRKETPLNIKNNPPKNPPNNNVNENNNVNNNENKLIFQNENYFDEFWKSYFSVKTSNGMTSKGSKDMAETEYKKLLKKYNHFKIMEATKKYLKFCQENNQKTKMVYGFLKHHFKEFAEDDCKTYIVAKTGKQTEAEKSRAILDQYIKSIKK